ncbi:hypothetical protein [Rheinheimera sp. MM224]|uniref:hypothetical protein n=1 Tax=Rheinheimera sp. MM224 TaxID=3019969 RepID=UPI0021F8AF72|nr:hypothetical protein [Rheinheimera sp. MM224]
MFIQNRPVADGIYSIFSIIRSVFLYQSYGYYLAERALEAGHNIDKGLYPFFGYASEFIAKLIGGASVPIDSKFVGDLHVLGVGSTDGRPFLANIVYPWWAWFVAYFGFFGLFVKAIFVFFFLSFLLNFRMIFSLVLILSFVILGTAGAHPFLTLTHTMSFAVAFLLDLYVIAFSKYSVHRR